MFTPEIQAKLKENPPDHFFECPEGKGLKGLKHYLSIDGVWDGMCEAFGAGNWGYDKPELEELKSANDELVGYRAWVNVFVLGTDGVERVWQQQETSVSMLGTRGVGDIKRAQGTAISDAVKRAVLPLGRLTGNGLIKANCPDCIAKASAPNEREEARERAADERKARKPSRGAVNAVNKAPNFPAPTVDENGMPLTAGGGAPNPDLPRRAVNGSKKSFDEDFAGFMNWLGGQGLTLDRVGQTIGDETLMTKEGLREWCNANQTDLKALSQIFDKARQAEAAGEPDELLNAAELGALKNG